MERAILRAQTSGEVVGERELAREKNWGLVPHFFSSVLAPLSLLRLRVLRRLEAGKR